MSLLVVSRVLLLPRYLISFDEINFAFAIRDFNPALHQPQPPGYPLFVGLLKALSYWLSDVETIFLTAGVILSTVALALIWRFSDAAIGRGSGPVACLLLLFNPVFWLSSLTNPVRLALSAGAIAIALCLWRSMERNSGRWFAAAAVLAGIAAGFRVTLPLIMAPLFAWVAFRIRLRYTTAGLAAVCALAGVATWLPFLLSAAGGWRAYLDLLRAYSHDQLAATSVLYGAHIAGWLVMGGHALMWSCLGALSWLLALPIALRSRSGVSLHAGAGVFLCLWFLTGLLVYATLHAADPDHTLAVVPVTCIAGAAVLTRITTKKSALAFIVAAAVLLNIVLFFKPISKPTKSATYRPIEWLNSHLVNVIDGVRTLQREGPLVVVIHHDMPGWRNLTYYVPEVGTITFASTPGGRTVAVHRQDGRAHHVVNEGSVVVAGCATVAWADPYVGPSKLNGDKVPAVRGGLYAARCVPGDSFYFRDVRFTIAQ